MSMILLLTVGGTPFDAMHRYAPIDVTAQQSLILIVKLLPNCGVSNLGYYTINELPK